MNDFECALQILKNEFNKGKYTIPAWITREVVPKLSSAYT